MKNVPEEVYAVLACYPTNEEDRRKIGIVHFKPHEGSIKSKCAECGCEVWVGPKQSAKEAELNKEGKTTAIVCVPCAVKDYKPGDDVRACGPSGHEIGTVRDT